jgi:hypothetical protein
VLPVFKNRALYGRCGVKFAYTFAFLDAAEISNGAWGSGLAQWDSLFYLIEIHTTLFTLLWFIRIWNESKGGRGE